MPIPRINHNIFKFLEKESSLTPCQVDELIVRAYILINRINNDTHNLLAKTLPKELIEEFVSIWQHYQTQFTLEDMCLLFEFVISPEEKEINGAIYTPLHIREYIVDAVLTKADEAHICELVFGDISCGCGGFLLTLAQTLHKRYGITYRNIYERNLVGVDVAQYSINRTRIILDLLAISEGEAINDIRYNLICANSLAYNFMQIPIVEARNGFDFIVGNPPYVSSAKIDEDSKQYLDRWKETSTGKADLYIPFFQLSINWLREGGRVGYITVNNFYKSLNGRALRTWFSDHLYGIEMIDFGSEQVFKTRTTYTCICFVTKAPNGVVSYTRGDSKRLYDISPVNYHTIPYHNLDNEKGWILASNDDRNYVRLIESVGVPLGRKFVIANGFATLRNEIYVFSPINENAEYYTLRCKYGEFKIEKGICRDAIKPNIIRTDADVISKQEQVIFPYERNEKTIRLLSEHKLRKNYPYAYSYLKKYKDELRFRDKGKKEYAAWYAYGRDQSLNLSGYKLLFPYIAETPRFALCTDSNVLFYNGYAICSQNIEDLKILQKILSSKLFWKYITIISKPYNNGYYALAKNYIKYFGIPDLSVQQREYILHEKDYDKIFVFLCKIYKIKI